VFRYIAVRVGYTDIAEDLTSETFVRALRCADKFADQGKPLGA
jgi:RNA polymerase sigma-70 factor (ECF subfamily)